MRLINKKCWLIMKMGTQKSLGKNHTTKMKKELVEKTKERTNPYKSVTDHQKFRLILILILKNNVIY